MLESWTQPALAANLHTIFRVQDEHMGMVELELIEVSDLQRTPRQEIYSIVFRGPLNQPLGQGMYQTEHASLETGALFIVPIAREDDGYRYEAVFNHLVKKHNG
jgi:hypothetical protein